MRCKICCVTNTGIAFHHFDGEGHLCQVLRSTLPFLLLSALAISGPAQDPLKRMAPDAWLSLPGVEAMRDWAGEHSSSTSLTVMSQNGSFHAPLGLGPHLLVRHGDLRVVLDSSGANRSNSHNLGFNLAAKHLRFNQRLYSLGGRGFWNAHAKLVEFIEKTGEWELVMMEGGPHCTTVLGVVSIWTRELSMPSKRANGDGLRKSRMSCGNWIWRR